MQQKLQILEFTNNNNTRHRNFKEHPKNTRVLLKSYVIDNDVIFVNIHDLNFANLKWTFTSLVLLYGSVLCRQ